MTYTLPAWADAPSITTPVGASNLLALNAAINDLDTRATTGPKGGYQSAGMWEANTYGDLMSSMGRAGATSTFAMTSTTRTQLVLLGLTPANTYSAFKLFVTTAQVAGTMTAALYSSAARTNNIWNRLGSGNVTPTLTSTGLVSTSLAFTLGSDAWVLLALSLTTAPTTYPAFAAGGAGQATLLNPASGAPVSGNANASATPGSTLDPTTGFTGLNQKIWAALA